jgi:hypothetical protein
MKRVLYLILVASSILPMELLENLKANRLPERLEQSKGHGIWQEHIKPPSVFIPDKFGEMMLYHSDKGFRVYQNDKKYKIDRLFTDARVRNATREELHSFLQNGYLVINRTTTGEFTLRANERLVGGGPLFGKIMYWTTKTLCYSILVATAGALVIAGGAGAKGVAGTSTPSGANVGDVFDTVVVQAPEAYVILDYGAAATMTQASGEAIFSPVVVNGSMAVAGAVGAGIIKAGYAAEAASATGAVLSTGTSSTGIVAGIEAVSLAVGIFCGFTPTP